MSIPGVDLRVEIAFDSGFRTPDADRTWIDVSDYVELEDALSITYGRQDELSVADANQLTLTLDNTDGRFTYGNASSPYYPNLKIGRPIRVTAIIDAVEYVRFTGYINEWPTEWPSGGEEYAAASISASSRLSRLGLDSPLASTKTLVPLREGAIGVWPLGDSSESTSATNYAPTPPFGELVQTGAGEVAFGSAPGPTGTDNEAPLFSGGKLRAVGAAPAADCDAGYALEFWVRPTVTPTTTVPVAFFGPTDPSGGRGGVGFALNASLQPVVTWLLDSGTTVSTTLAALELNAPTHFLVRARRNTATLGAVQVYRDGVLDFNSSAPMASLVVSEFGLAVGSTPDAPFDGVISGVAAYVGADVLLIDAADLAGAAGAFSGDTTDGRLSRLADWARIPNAEVLTSDSPVELSGIPGDGGQIVDLMRQVETAEAGVLHDDRDGNLVLLPRSARYAVGVGLSLDASAERVGADYAPKVDRQGLANVGRGTNTLGTVEVTYTNEASREEYGDAAYDVETSALYDAEPFHLISWQINANAEPRPRAPSVTIDVLPYLDDPDLADVLNTDIGTKVRVANAPSQAPEVTADYFAEGYSETFGEASWLISLNLSPVAPYDDVFILDSATDGVLDTDVLAL